MSGSPVRRWPRGDNSVFSRGGMFLSPSKVNFTSSIQHLGVSKMAADSHISDFYREMKMCRGFPRLQVVQKNGHYFTLDNSRLYMFRRMEEEGHCKLVPIDIVLLKKVPEAVQDTMVLPHDGIIEPDVDAQPQRKRFRLRHASEFTTFTFRSPKRVKELRSARSVSESPVRYKELRESSSVTASPRRINDLRETRSVSGSPRKVTDLRETRSITGSLETCRRRLSDRRLFTKRHGLNTEDEHSVLHGSWPDEKQCLL